MEKTFCLFLAFSRFPFVKVTAVCGFNQTYLYSRREKKSKSKRKRKCKSWSKSKSAQKWKVCLRRVEETGERLLKRRKAACQWFMNCSHYKENHWVGLFHWQLALRGQWNPDFSKNFYFILQIGVGRNFDFCVFTYQPHSWTSTKG